MSSLVCDNCSPPKRVVWNKPTEIQNITKKPEETKKKTASRKTSRSPSYEQFYTEMTLRNGSTLYLHYIDTEDHYWYLCQDILPYIERIDDSNDMKRFLKRSLESEDQRVNSGKTYIQFESYCSIIDEILQKGISNALFEDFSTVVDVCIQMKKMIRERDKRNVSFQHPMDLFGDLSLD